MVVVAVVNTTQASDQGESQGKQAAVIAGDFSGNVGFIGTRSLDEEQCSTELVASQGFEPQYAESESAVLPLNDEAIIAGTAHDVKQPGHG